MIRTTICAALLIGAPVLSRVSAQEGQEAEPSSVSELATLMKEREGALTSVLMEMVSRGTYPGGVSFEIEGTVRVLGEERTATFNRTTFDDDLNAEFEQVITPEGTWTRERDPAFGEVFLKIEPNLMAEIKSALELLSGGAGAPGQMGGGAKDPLGSAMLESLDEHFDLALTKKVIKGADYFVVSGPVRAGVEAAESEMPAVDRVELLVRPQDFAVMQMTHFLDGKETMQTKITRLQLDLPMEPSSFRIDLPEGARFVDVMDHPPAAAQIRQLLEDAETQRVEAEQAKSAAGKSK